MKQSRKIVPRLRLLLVVLLAQFSLLAIAAPQGWSPLLEPAGLASMLASSSESAATVRIVQVTGNYQEGHIPGAVFSAYGQWRGPQENPGALPEISHLVDLVQELGITAQTPVVVVHQGSSAADMGAATRVYWTLKSLGVVDLAVLNGGFNAWREAGLPVSTAAETVAASSFVPRWQDTWQISTAEIETLVSTGEPHQARLIDARTEGFFRGEQSVVARAGTIKGAGNVSYESWFEGNRMRSTPLLASTLINQELPTAPLTVSFCNTGHLASINWFVMSELTGVENTRLYAESMGEWSQANRPMDNQPSRMSIYWDKTMTWLDSLFES
ncbi:MAG: rhodanese-like domain-containing protein [Pseudomonadales bacterium]|nr:rhodanese-like domain-containing protein [Pseudomonadales bacterium]